MCAGELWSHATISSTLHKYYVLSMDKCITLYSNVSQKEIQNFNENFLLYFYGILDIFRI